MRNFSRIKSTNDCCINKFIYTIPDETNIKDVCDKYINLMMKITDEEIVMKLVMIVVDFKTRTNP